jgi:hypothetical protein
MPTAIRAKSKTKPKFRWTKIDRWVKRESQPVCFLHYHYAGDYRVTWHEQVLGGSKGYPDHYTLEQREAEGRVRIVRTFESRSGQRGVSKARRDALAALETVARKDLR